MSREYDLHRNGDCDTFCRVCEWEDLNDGLDRRLCEECDRIRDVEDEFDDQIGYEEQARPVHVVALDCGHDIVTDRKEQR